MQALLPIVGFADIYTGPGCVPIETFYGLGYNDVPAPVLPLGVCLPKQRLSRAQ